MTPNTFEALPLAAPLHRALAALDYTTPTPIQARSIPPILDGRDLLGCAQTGTGKTAAFSLPILHHLEMRVQRPRPKSARVLVLAPTRELAHQVGKSLETYGTFLRFRHALVYGGVGQRPQVAAMRRGVDVLVACPGRLLDLVEQGFIDLSTVEFFVLDEVDRMLDMGFVKDVKRIVSLLPRKRQSLFFSATMPAPIVALSHTILSNPVTVRIEPETTTAPKVDQKLCFVAKDDKRSLLLDCLRQQGEGELAMVFSRTKHGADKLARFLKKEGITAEAIHGNRSQSQRDKTLGRFRGGELPVMVATDVAARGVDVKDVTLVVNFDLPNEQEAYVHRIGRTGRAGEAGMAVSFCAPDERDALRDIEKLIGKTIPVDEKHRWHLATLAEEHVRNGATSNGGGKKRGGGGRRSQPGGRGRSQGHGRRGGRGSRGPRKAA